MKRSQHLKARSIPDSNASAQVGLSIRFKLRPYLSFLFRIERRGPRQREWIGGIVVRSKVAHITKRRLDFFIINKISFIHMVLLLLDEGTVNDCSAIFVPKFARTKAHKLYHKIWRSRALFLPSLRRSCEATFEFLIKIIPSLSDTDNNIAKQYTLKWKYKN